MQYCESRLIDSDLNTLFHYYEISVGRAKIAGGEFGFFYFDSKISFDVQADVVAISPALSWLGFNYPEGGFSYRG